jgi:short-subunit dehydrogenase
MATALITGASAGIGLAFAERFAAEGLDLVLVSRNQESLDQVAARLRSAHPVSVDVMPADLSVRTDVDRIGARLAAEARPIEILVNNAGFGINDEFIGGDLEAEQQLLDVLVTAPMRLSHAALPGMVERNSGAVINVSSIAGWMVNGTYSAAKAWLTTFTESLSRDLAGTGVQAVAVCPGLTHTEFHERADMRVDHAPEWLWLDADEVVERALRDAGRGKPISVAGRQYRAISLFTRYAPRPLIRRIRPR